MNSIKSYKNNSTIISSIFSTQLSSLSSILTSNYIKPGLGKLDKLYLRVPCINEVFLNNQCVQITYIKNSKGRQYEHHDKYFIVTSLDNDYKIEINPSHFQSFSNLKHFCEKIFFDISSARITRVDCAVMLDSNIYPVDFFYFCTYLPRKTLSNDYLNIKREYKSGFLTGFDIGKYPFRASCYDVDTRNKAKDKFIELTNFEIQLSKHNQSTFIIERFEQLSSIIAVNPFEDVCFKNVFFLISKDLSETRRKQLVQFQRLIYQRGYHNARGYVRNMFGNFDRDYNPYFPELKIGAQQVFFKEFLLESFRAGVDGWLSK